jgi:uncharacterized membrane protein
MKNYYIGVCIVFILATLAQFISFLCNLFEYDIYMSLFWAILAIAFSFTTGRLLEKAIQLHKLNQSKKFLQEFTEVIKIEIEKEKSSPFKEFEVPFPEVKKEKKDD